MNITAWDIPALLAAKRAEFGSARMEDAPPPADAPPADAPPVDKTFTQAELDRIVADRVKRAKPADYDELRASAKRLAEIEAANATDLEKAVKAARDEGRAEVQTAANARLVTAEARAVAAELKFKNPALAVRTVDLSAVKVSDDGEVDADAVKAALQGLAESDPYLVGEETPRTAPSFGGGPRSSASIPTDPRSADLAQIEADLKAAARK